MIWVLVTFVIGFCGGWILGHDWVIRNARRQVKFFERVMKDAQEDK